MGRHVFVAGTASVDSSGVVVAPHDGYGQTKHILSIIKKALEKAGSGLEDVVRTRIYVTNIAAHAHDVGRAHAEYFQTVKPACTMFEISGLIDDKMVVEIEAQALME